MQFRVSPKALDNYSTEEWQARVDLAAAHRLAFNQGFSEGIFNHLTLTVPGRTDRYYEIPFGMHWSEVTASSFMEVGIDDGRSSAARVTSNVPATASTRRSTRRCRRPRRCFTPTCPMPAR